MPRFDRSLVAPLLLSILAVACSGGGFDPQVRLHRWTPPEAVVREGGLSDLTLDPSDPSGRTMLAINDRGPNDAKGDQARFPFPGYHQKLLRFRFGGDGEPSLVGVDSLRTAQGRWTTGLPSPFFPGVERAFGKAANGTDSALGTDSAGYDFEGVAADGGDGIWVSEEYGPRLAHLVRDSVGYRVDRSFAPGTGLPEVFARREPNKGLEALCRTPGGLLVAAFQGALDNASDDRPGISRRSLARRILVLDPAKGTVREFLEQVDDDPAGKPSRRTKTGACAALDERRVVMLEHRRTGKKSEGAQADLVLLDLSRATDVHLSADREGRGRRVGGRTLEELALSVSGLLDAGIRPAHRTVLVADLTRGLPGVFEKPEGLVLRGDSTFVVVFDNDYGIASGDVSTRFVVGRLPVPLPGPDR